MDPKLLEEIGLTRGETQVYLALLRLGEITTGPLAAEAGVSSSKVYKILDRLQRKGLVANIVKQKTKHFRALEPRRVLDYLDEREREIKQRKEVMQKILPELELAQRSALHQHSAAVYDGFKAVMNLFRGIIDELKAGETYYVLGATYADILGLRPFFHNHHMRRADKGIRLKMLANYDVKEKMEKTTFRKAEVRFLPQYLITPMQLLFYKNKAYVIIWTHEPQGFLIENAEAVKSFKAYFDSFWKIGKR